MSCPFCGTHVEVAVENSPDWYRDPSLPVYRIDCHDKCRQYWLEAISDPHPHIDPAIRAFLESLHDEQRTFISESTQHACDNGILIVYNERIFTIPCHRLAVRKNRCDVVCVEGRFIPN